MTSISDLSFLSGKDAMMRTPSFMPRWFTETSVGRRVVQEAEAKEAAEASAKRRALGEQLDVIDTEQRRELPKLEAAEAKAMSEFEQVEAKYLAAKAKARDARTAKENAVASWDHTRNAIRRQLCKLCPSFVYDAERELADAASRLIARGVATLTLVRGGKPNPRAMTQEKLAATLARIHTARNSLLEQVRYDRGTYEDLQEKVNAIVAEALQGLDLNAPAELPEGVQG
jgi:hypothetical protein